MFAFTHVILPICGTWDHIKCVELAHTFPHNSAVYVCHLCIQKTFSGVSQYLCYNIDCLLSNNSGDPVVVLLNNFALLSIDEVRSFTFLKFQTNYWEKITQKIHIFSIELQTCQGITNQYNNCYMSASFQLLLSSCMHNFLPAENSVSSELLQNLNVVHKILLNQKAVLFIRQEKCFRRNSIVC